MPAPKVIPHFRVSDIRNNFSDIESLVDIQPDDDDTNTVVLSYRRTTKAKPVQVSFSLDAADAIADRLQQLTLSLRGQRLPNDDMNFYGTY